MPATAIRPEILTLESSGITKVSRLAMGDPDVTPLWFGESDIITPAFIRDAAKRALDEGDTFYSFSRGTLPLRQALLRYHSRLYGLELDPDRLVVPGSTMLAVTIACQCLVGKDDEVILVSPYWPNVATAIQVAGGRTVDVRLREGPGRWWLDLDEVAHAIGPRTKAIYVNSPSNPTGWVMPAEQLADLLALCRRHGLGLISDEVYHRNVFDVPDPAPSVLALADPDEPVFVVNGFSKAWAMTGWRLGWLVGPKHLTEPLTVLSEVANTGAPAFTQAGGIAALEGGEPFVAEFSARCRANRDLVMATLGSHPKVSLLRPEGSFYAFFHVAGVQDGLGLARRVLDEARVGLAAGYSFGAGNEAHLRLCFAVAPARMETALQRLCDVLDHL